MPQFRYIAKNMEGKTMRGVLEASGENVLQQQLKEQGLFLIEAKDVRGSKKAYKFSSAQLAEFCREMSTLLASGVSIVRALEITADEEGLAASRRSVYLEILSELKKGTSEFHHIGASAARDGHSCFLRMCMIHKVMY